MYMCKLFFLDTYLAKCICDTTRWCYFKKKPFRLTDILIHLFDWYYIFSRNCKNGKRKSEQKQNRNDRMKITWTEPHDLGKQAFVQSQKSVAEE